MYCIIYVEPPALRCTRALSVWHTIKDTKTLKSFLNIIEKNIRPQEMTHRYKQLFVYHHLLCRLTYWSVFFVNFQCFFGFMITLVCFSKSLFLFKLTYYRRKGIYIAKSPKHKAYCALVSSITDLVLFSLGVCILSYTFQSSRSKKSRSCTPNKSVPSLLFIPWLCYRCWKCLLCFSAQKRFKMWTPKNKWVIFGLYHHNAFDILSLLQAEEKLTLKLDEW